MFAEKRYIAMTLLAGACVTGTLNAAAVISTFETGPDGWTTNGDSKPIRWNADYQAGFGTDLFKGVNWYFVAPVEYRGDHADVYGTYLTYEFMTDKADKISPDPLLILSGGGMTLQWFQTMPNPTPKVWDDYRFLLSEEGDWVISGTRIKPTQEQFIAVLSNITDLQIRGEFYTSMADSGYLRHVVMGAPVPAVPEPASAAMLLMAGAGLLLRTRRK